MPLVTGLFFQVLLLNQRWSPPLRLQDSHCNTFCIMCDVPSTAVFCSESIECFPGTASKFFLKVLVTIPVAPIITGTIVHFRFHIRCIIIIISNNRNLEWNIIQEQTPPLDYISPSWSGVCSNDSKHWTDMNRYTNKGYSAVGRGMGDAEFRVGEII